MKYSSQIHSRWLEDIIDSGVYRVVDCRTGPPPAHIAWRGPVRQPYARVDFIPLARDYEFGYSMLCMSSLSYV
jgi:hypothetical protein